MIDEQSGEFRGSGFFCEIAGRRAVVTAAHVLQDAEKTEKFRAFFLLTR